MAHGITTTDKVTLYKDGAWHGMGEIVTDKMSAREAFDRSGLNWAVRFSDEPEISTIDGVQYKQDKFKTLWRLDGENSQPMGSFTDAYRPVQNEVLFDLGQEVINLAGEQNGEKMFLESCGSIHGGKKVWLLLNQECRQVNENDKVMKYVAIANSHDGKLLLGVKPTSVRVVCNNTLSQAFNSKKGNYITIAHKGHIESKIEAAKIILKNYFDVTAQFDESIRLLQGKKLNMKDALKIIKQQWNIIHPDKKKDGFYEEYITKSKGVLEKETNELKYNDVNLWLVANSISNIYQSEITGGGKKKIAIENNVYGNLLGVKDKVTSMVFSNIFKMAA